MTLRTLQTLDEEKPSIGRLSFVERLPRITMEKCLIDPIEKVDQRWIKKQHNKSEKCTGGKK